MRIDTNAGQLALGRPLRARAVIGRPGQGTLRCGLRSGAVVGHHPHIVQPYEIYRESPIFYSGGNFFCRSGNSCAEGLLVGLRCEDTRTAMKVYPLYGKNRNPRVNHQPKVLAGRAVERVLSELGKISGDNAGIMKLQNGRGHIELSRPSESSEAGKGIHE